MTSRDPQSCYEAVRLTTCQFFLAHVKLFHRIVSINSTCLLKVRFMHCATISVCSSALHFEHVWDRVNRVFVAERTPCCSRSTERATPVYRRISATNSSLSCSAKRPVSGSLFFQSFIQLELLAHIRPRVRVVVFYVSANTI